MNIITQNAEKYHKILTRCAAPVLEYVKPSSLVSLPKELKADDIILKTQNLEMMLLYKYRLSQMVFIFNRKMLNSIINNEKTHHLLKRYSYPDKPELDMYLEHLKKRLKDFTDKRTDFPHEIGVFLGYPYQDVMDFIDGKKDCCFCGYWKVYNNPHQALETMRKYWYAKEKAMTFYAHGKRYFEICS